MVTKEEIFDKIKEVLKDELFYEEQIELSSSIKDLGLDSIQIMQLFVYLEEAFSFEFFDDNMLEKIQSVSLGDFVDSIYNSITKVNG